ncbi:MAG: hypothetical protein NUV74_12130 [Candidatus Brocadiaceae bacterium]|nr:hypothetical protein [Candidatus Brocadiaceae bacterium]
MDKNFKEFLKLLNCHKVKYVIVGAYALGCYTEPRYTNDLDIFVEATTGNTAKMVRVLSDFGFDASVVNWNNFFAGREMIRLGYAPIRIDILASISGVTWNEVWKNKTRGFVDESKIPVYFIGKKQLIKNKKAARRPKDLSDIKQLE